MFIESIRESEKCVGCGNCKVVCPVNAVTMLANSEGFLYPSIDHSVCVQCGLCESHCPHQGLKYQEFDNLPEAIIIRGKDAELLKKVASGGLCTILSRYFIEDLKGYVCGAVYDDFFRVHHIVSNDIADIEQMRQSKYVQSDLEDCFQKIKEKLASDSHVLMIGTACQIYALKKYLGKEYEKLFCIDLICHGVPSPKAQQEYIKWLEQKHGKVSCINNRNKREFAHSYVNTYAVHFVDGKQLVNKYSDDPMADAFFRHLSIRKSCFDCQFKTVRRISDLTIGDFWFSEQYGFGEDTLGANLCIVQSEKGIFLLKQLSGSLNQKSINTEVAAVLNGGMLYSSCKENKNRHLFFERLGKESFEKLVFELDGINSIGRFKYRLRMLIDPILRKTKRYNKMLKKSAKARKKRVIPESKKGQMYY